MGAVTYPQHSVVEEVNNHFIACKLESAKSPEVARAMNVRWLPGLVVAAPDGRLAHTQIGFLPADDFLSELRFGRAIVRMGEKRYDEAHALFRAVAESDAERAPEAYYWLGISRFRQTKSVESYREAWSHILKKWPDSQWARKVGYIVKN